MKLIKCFNSENGGKRRLKNRNKFYVYKNRNYHNRNVPNSFDWRKAELSSAATQASARGLAKLAAYLANKGKLSEDDKIMSE